jgi:hypothetical protein
VRIAILVLAIVGLGAAIWLLWLDSPADETPGTEAVAPSTTTSTTQEPLTTTTVAPSTSTTFRQETHVVESVEEAEAILRELWFGWFEGIYNQDEERIREVVATQHQVELARDQFGQMNFSAPPEPEGILYGDTEILLANEDCTVIWTTATLSGFTSGSTSDVHILRWNDDAWKFFSLWSFRGDLWEGDCDAQLGP